MRQRPSRRVVVNVIGLFQSGPVTPSARKSATVSVVTYTPFGIVAALCLSGAPAPARHVAGNGEALGWGPAPGNVRRAASMGPAAGSPASASVAGADAAAG